MKVIIKLFTLVIAFAIILFSCEQEDATNVGDGTLSLALTDAPIDGDSVSGVYITVTGIQYNKDGEKWKTFEEFEGPKKFNLMELTGGDTAMLGNFNAGAGNYTGLRFMLEAAERGQGGGKPHEHSNPGCYLQYKDSSTQALFVPSGGQTGYKAVGNFSVPTNGEVSVTADFDARKSVVKAGNSGMFILKPTIRLIVNNEAGKIEGTLSNMDSTNADSAKSYIVYAYEDGTYDSTEAADPEAEEPRFPSAVSSYNVKGNGDYVLAFLAPKTYDLVVTEYVEDEFSKVLGIVEDIEVTSNATKQEDIDFTQLEN